MEDIATNPRANNIPEAGIKISDLVKKSINGGCGDIIRG